MIKAILAIMSLVIFIQPSVASEHMVKKYSFSMDSEKFNFYIPKRFSVQTGQESEKCKNIVLKNNHITYLCAYKNTGIREALLFSRINTNNRGVVSIDGSTARIYRGFFTRGLDEVNPYTTTYEAVKKHVLGSKKGMISLDIAKDSSKYVIIPLVRKLPNSLGIYLETYAFVVVKSKLYRVYYSSDYNKHMDMKKYFKDLESLIKLNVEANP